MTITWVISDGVDTGGGGDSIRRVPFAIDPPQGATTRAPTTTGRAPTSIGPSVTTVVPSSGQEPASSSGGTSYLWILLVALALVILAAAAVGNRSRRRPRPREQVRARVRPGPPTTPRIEQIGERPAWVLRIDPHRDRPTERIEELQR